MPTKAATTRWLTVVAPWLPIVMLVVSASVAFILAGRVVDGGQSAVWWVSASVAVGLAAARSPGGGLLLLVFLLPAVPYVRYDTWLGKELPTVIAAAVVVGAALNPAARWGQLLRDARRQVATPVLAFAAVLAVSTVLVLLQRSPFVTTVVGWRLTGGVFAGAWPELQPQSTGPILRAGGFLLGPLFGLLVLSFLRKDRDGALGPVNREAVVSAFLLTSAANLGVACGQVFVPGFPIATLYQPVAGLFHNAGGLAQLMTLAAPVALAVSLGPTRIWWLRPLAVVTVVLVAVLFVPIQQRAAHVGVTTGVACMLGLVGWLLARRDRSGFRRVVAVTAVVAVLFVAGLAVAVTRTADWQPVRSAIRDAPFSTAWLGTGLRQETNRMAFFMVGDRPFGGYGIGGFEAALPAYYDEYGPLVRRYDHSLLNHPLHMVVDFGAFGFVANLWLLGAFVLSPIRAVVAGVGRWAGTAATDPLAIGCLAGAGAALVLSIWSAEWLYDPPISIPAFTLLALAAAPIAPAEDTRRRGVAVWSILAFPMGHALMFVLGV